MLDAYRPPLLLRHGDLHTVAVSQLRRPQPPPFWRERIDTPDDDFLDIDWVRTGNRRVAVLSHGLEGSSQRPYVVGMARALHRHGWDICAWNFRSCSGEINRTRRMYHSGEWTDLDLVVRHAVEWGYDEVVLVGFSLGANVSIVYAGQTEVERPPELSAVIAFSLSRDLGISNRYLSRRRNWVYMKSFLDSLHEKLKVKAQQYPGEFDLTGYERIRTFLEFDHRYTAPTHGFASGADYHERCSTKHFIPTITVPTLIVNAEDDPFLPLEAHPFEDAARNPNVTFELTRYGGHVGWYREGEHYLSELRAIDFLAQLPGGL